MISCCWSVTWKYRGPGERLPRVVGKSSHSDFMAKAVPWTTASRGDSSSMFVFRVGCPPRRAPLIILDHQEVSMHRGHRCTKLKTLK